MLVCFSFLAAACSKERAPKPQEHAGSESCRECHEEAHDLWRASHHALAERPFRLDVDAAAFRGKGAIRHGSLESSVALEDGEPRILTAGLDGALRPFPVSRVIGEFPLRQFLVPAERGRFQVAALSYDPAKDEWFDVFGEEDRRPHEWGFWLNRGMNWNSMCADCHNTNLRKNYDAAADAYRSEFTELGVGCEACHGPSGEHVVWQRANRDEEDDPTLPWLRVPEDVNAWVDTCGACHSRRMELVETYDPAAPFLEAFLPELLDLSEVYYADSQVHDEDYEYVSFLMSRMGQSGEVTCLSCHEPHGGKLRAAGNKLCMACHRDQRGTIPPIDPAAHSHHDVAREGGSCVGCHMPLTTYMQRHPRRDHGLTIPDPLLTKELGIPNACGRCHAEEGVDWAIEAVEKWYGARMERPTRIRARLVARARSPAEDAAAPLIAALPAEKSPVWRATYALLLVRFAGQVEARAALASLLADSSPLVRAMAARALELPCARSRPALLGLLEDPCRAVRVQAAWTLRAEVDLASRAGQDLLNYLGQNADQPAGVMMEATLRLDRGEVARAIELLRLAVAWEPNSAATHQNLAIALSRAGRPLEALPHCERACELMPEDAALWYSLGLARAEAGEGRGAVAALETSCRLDPGLARAWYNLGLARKELLGDAAGGIAALETATALEPESAAFWYALAALCRDVGLVERAAEAADRALAVDPSHRSARALRDSLAR
ncbi:MAG: tetratricopeptide repeat protein [Planctomycetes bacterium]|nr:tetratricopeptide repeat protein [Planctomycetota bacterium]